MNTKPAKDKPSDPEWLAQLRLDIAELTNPREIHKWVPPDKTPTKSAADPELAARRSGGFSWPPPHDPTQAHHAVHLSLLAQLHRLRNGMPAGRDGGGGGRRAPGSRLPAGSDVADLIADIEAGCVDLHRQAITALNRARELHRRDSYGRRRLIRPEPHEALQRLLDIAPDVNEQIRQRICRQVHAWVLTARLTLSYSAPMATLSKTCPYCKQQTLITRSDASGDVFCATDGCTDDNGQQPRWPRSTWHLLLTTSEPA